MEATMIKALSFGVALAIAISAPAFAQNPASNEDFAPPGQACTVSGKIRCEDYCKKHRAGSDGCLKRSEKSCEKAYGTRGYDKCVWDTPPSNQQR